MSTETVTLKRCHTCGQWPSITRKQLEKVIAGMHDTNGYGWSAIANRLNDMRIPTLAGGVTWWPSTVQAIYRKATGAEK